MSANCRHIMPTGLTCRNPAMRYSAYCYQHTRLHQSPRRGRPPKHIVIQSLDTSKALLTSLTEVMNALAAGRISKSHSGKLIYCFQIATEGLKAAALAQPRAPKPQPPQSRPPQTQLPPSSPKQTAELLRLLDALLPPARPPVPPSNSRPAAVPARQNAAVAAADCRTITSEDPQ